MENDCIATGESARLLIDEGRGRDPSLSENEPVAASGDLT